MGAKMGEASGTIETMLKAFTINVLKAFEGNQNYT